MGAKQSKRVENQNRNQNKIKNIERKKEVKASVPRLYPSWNENEKKEKIRVIINQGISVAQSLVSNETTKKNTALQKIIQLMISDQLQKGINTGSVPLVLHQMWLDKKDKSRILWPDKYSNYVYNMRNKNLDFHHHFWNMEMVELLFEIFPQVFKKYQTFFTFKLQRWIEKCDFARWMILSVFGGLYVDLDFNCLKNLTPLLTDKEFVWTEQPLEHGRDLFINGWVGSAAFFPFTLIVLETIHKEYDPPKGVLANTGPNKIQKIMQEHGGREAFLGYFCPPRYTMPYKSPYWNFGRKLQVCKDCYDDPDWNTNLIYTYTNWNEGSFWWLPWTLKM